jgi:hypothetical protein
VFGAGVRPPVVLVEIDQYIEHETTITQPPKPIAAKLGRWKGLNPALAGAVRPGVIQPLQVVDKRW